MTEPDDTVTVECDLPDAPEKVWRALTVPELLAVWLAPNDIRPEPGARFRLAATPDLGGPVECEVLTAEAPHLLRYRWRQEDGALDSVVSFELTRTVRGGTRLRLVHDGFPLDLTTPLATLMQRRVLTLRRRTLAVQEAFRWAA